MATQSKSDGSPPSGDEPEPTVCYESYLLRLRRTISPNGERRQVYVRAVQSGETRYFNSLRELIAYLRRSGTTR